MGQDGVEMGIYFCCNKIGMVLIFCSMRLKYYVNVIIPECYREQFMAEACKSSNGYISLYQQGKRRIDEIVRLWCCFNVQYMTSYHLQAGT